MQTQLSNAFPFFEKQTKKTKIFNTFLSKNKISNVLIVSDKEIQTKNVSEFFNNALNLKAVKVRDFMIPRTEIIKGANVPTNDAFVPMSGKLVLEIANNQKKEVKDLLRKNSFYINSVVKDLANNDRCIILSLIHI